jgi:predicted nucleic acid-binding protein
MRKLRVYADTSVFGGCFDAEFAKESKQFFLEIESGKFTLLISDTTVQELLRAPDQVRDILHSVPTANLEIQPVTEEIISLRDAYLAEGIVGPSAQKDAEHIAAATVAQAAMVISWNFKHIVHYDKISGYCAVNLLRGYGEIRIYSPREVVDQ